jgi:hypothetical protein
MGENAPDYRKSGSPSEPPSGKLRSYVFSAMRISPVRGRPRGIRTITMGSVLESLPDRRNSPVHNASWYNRS